MPSTIVECAPQIAPFSAKQTQFPKRQNHRTLLCHKELHQYSTPPESKKQTQTNPIPRPLLRRETIQNLGPKRISPFVRGASKIEYPVSRIFERSGNPEMSGNYLTHLAAHSWLNCAKQTQSPKTQNHPNLLLRKDLQ